MKHPKIVLPILTLVVGFVAGGGMIITKRSAPTERPERALPLVRVITATPEAVELRVATRGSVVPRTESDLVAEVAGRIVEVSPRLAAGGFVEPGEVLIRIDPQDYEIAGERARAALTRAESELELARASLTRHERLRARGVDSAAAHESAQNAARVAEAARDEARAAFRQAERDLARTEIRAPFAGRVREKHVDRGQFVARGAAVARLYAVDYAEVRLPIPDAETAFVDLPIAYRNEAGDADDRMPRVVLSAEFAGRSFRWEGRIVRTEGELDPRTRMIHAVARVEDPYGRGDDPDRPPLAVGLFVEAEIVGRRVENVVVLPRAALRGEQQVAVVSDRGRLRMRNVDVLRRERDRVLIRGGLEAGEQVCTSPLPIRVEEMAVRVVRDAATEDVRRDGDGVVVVGSATGERP